MSNIVKVSVVIPVYNVEPYIKKCLSTLVDQTMHDNIELIFINDKSTDNCLDILKQYQEKYGNDLIKIIDHKHNQGVAASRNDGITIAKGEYIGFVDPDDWVDLNFFEVLYNDAKKNDLDINISNVLDYLNDSFKYECNISFKEKILKIKQNIITEPIDKQYNIYYGYIWNKIYRKSFIDKYLINFPDFSIMEDMYFNFFATALSNRVGINLDVFYYYRREVKDSLTDKYDKKTNNFMFLIFKSIRESNLMQFADGEYLKILEAFKINHFCNYFHFISENDFIILKTELKKINIRDNKYIKDSNRIKYLNIINSNFSDFNILKNINKYKNYIKLFNVIPIIEIKYSNTKSNTYLKLFNVIPILKIISNEIKPNTCLKLFNFIPILEIKYSKNKFCTYLKLFNVIPILKINREKNAKKF